MKLKHSILPLFGVGASVFAAAPFMTSCAPLAQLVGDESDGEFVYDESIELPETGPLKPDECTDLYYKAVDKNRNIFTNDLAKMCYGHVDSSSGTDLHYWRHGFAFGERARGSGGISSKIVPNESYLNYFRATHIEVKLGQGDVLNYRVSFSLNVKFACDIDAVNYHTTAALNLSMEDCPMSFASDTAGVCDQISETHDSYLGVMMPSGCVDGLVGVYSLGGEVVDPRGGGGIGAEHLAMCMYHDGRIKLDEQYKTPEKTFNINMDIDDNYFKELNVPGGDSDPEILAAGCYSMSFVFYLEGFHYLDNVQIWEEA